MKIAPLLRASVSYPQVENLLVHTGQHYDASMSEVFFGDLGIPRPDINLEVGSGSHAVQTAEIMQRFEPVVLAEKPDLVLVVGDVNSTLACSLVAAKLHIPIAHVEAGVRSFDRSMPEEINRIVTDALSDFLFTPSRSAGENLLRQGVSADKIFFVGNVMVDSLLQAYSIAAARRTWQKWDLTEKGYAVLTLHRAANVDDPTTLGQLLQAIGSIANSLPVLFPVHPRTLRRLVESGLADSLSGYTQLILAEPLGYLEFLCLLGGARLVLTDSGGIQAETTVLGVPCLTLRENTEWPETLSAGTNRLVGADPQRIQAGFQAVMQDRYAHPARPEGWDGQAAQRILAILAERFS
jgi:UDP-N-acetylglucosamine 2-epimerase (non-hydrolysing)